MIEHGIFHLGQAAAGDELSEYHLQAGIAACHCTADDYESTDWPRILSLYDQWMKMNDSPVIALNRAVAIATGDNWILITCSMRSLASSRRSCITFRLAPTISGRLFN